MSNLQTSFEKTFVGECYEFVIAAELGHFDNQTCLPYLVEGHFNIKKEAGGISSFLEDG